MNALQAARRLARQPVVRALADLLARAAALGLLVAGLMAYSTWVGRAVLAPGAWLEADIALYRAWNGLDLGPLTALFTATLNEPGPNYLALILIILGYCWWRKRALLPAVALAIAVALGLGLAATGRTLDAGGGSRVRPFVLVSAARTPITTCDGLVLIALRDQVGPTASCDGSPSDLVGLDWRVLWLEFPTFPSGHLRETAALCLLLGALWPAARPYALAYALVLAFSRIHLGAHYPSDVLAGALLGLGTASIALLGLDLLRRLLVYLHRVPPLGAAWDWMAVSRVAGRPDLDPLAARLIRLAACVVIANLALVGIGYAATNPRASQIYSVLQNADIWAFSQLASRWAPAATVASYIAAALSGPLYLLLAAAILAVTWYRGRALLGRTLVALLVALALAFQLRWLGQHVAYRLPPSAHALSALPPLWQGIGDGSYPSLPALVMAVLAGILAGAWPRAALPAQALGLAGALAPVYLGEAWLVDGLAGYLLGNLAAACGWYAVRQLAAPIGARVGAEPAVAASDRPADVSAADERALAGRDP